jgi:hypothetical protein
VSKADVQVTGGNNEAWVVETTSVLRGDQDRQWELYEHRFTAEVDAVERRHRVNCVSTLNDHPDFAIIQAWLQEIDTVAAAVARTGASQTVHSSAGTVNISTDQPAPGTATRTGAPQYRDGWKRIRRALADKARQTEGPIPVWIRIDALDGIFQFTEWSRAAPGDRIAMIAGAIETSISWPENTFGVVLSSGLGTSFSGDAAAENLAIDGAQGSWTRRLVAPRIVRETFVIPLTRRADPQTQWWTRAYRDEPNWLDNDLADAQLPPLSDFWQPM